VSVDFSVVIPTFRRPEPLTAALQSVLSQAGVTVEVFIVDDSPEGSALGAVTALSDARVIYLRNPQPTGGVPGIVRNLAWPWARGRYVHFLDDDDRVPEGHYAAAKAAFEAHPNIGVLFGRVAPFGESAAQVEHEERYFARAARRALFSRWFGARWAFAGRMLFGETMLVCSAALVRRECIDPLNGFDPDSRLVEDVDFYGRAIRRFGVYFMDRIALHYRVGVSLIHRPGVQATIEQSYRLMHDNYRAQWGRLDFILLKLFTRTLLRWP